MGADEARTRSDYSLNRPEVVCEGEEELPFRETRIKEEGDVVSKGVVVEVEAWGVFLPRGRLFEQVQPALMWSC